MQLDQLDTPIVAVDLDAVERNIERVQSYCDDHQLAFRPHIKTHKIPAIAHMQLRAGAVGVTCQKLGEAEVMAGAGITDILITYPLLGPQKLERLCALAKIANVMVVSDSEMGLKQLSAALSREGVQLDLLVECDTGFGRTGVQSPADAASLSKLVNELPGLRFAGLMTYPTVAGSGPWLRSAREAIEASGQRVETISGGGTSTYRFTHEIGEITEVRCGTYVYGDAACVAEGTVPLKDTALHVRTRIVSRPTATRAIVDAGSKTLTNDPNEAGGGGHGIVLEYPEAKIYQLHEEHGFVDLNGCVDRPNIGEIITIVPNHACGCTNLHNTVAAHKDGTVIGLWPVAARGLVQ